MATRKKKAEPVVLPARLVRLLPALEVRIQQSMDRLNDAFKDLEELRASLRDGNFPSAMRLARGLRQPAVIGQLQELHRHTMEAICGNEETDKWTH